MTSCKQKLYIDRYLLKLEYFFTNSQPDKNQNESIDAPAKPSMFVYIIMQMMRWRVQLGINSKCEVEKFAKIRRAVGERLFVSC